MKHLIIFMLILLILLKLCGCNMQNHSSMRYMLYQGTGKSELGKMYPNYFIVKLEGTNLLLSIYINRPWQKNDNINSNNVYLFLADECFEEEDFNGLSDNSLDSKEPLISDVYYKFEEQVETNLTRIIKLTFQETNILWSAFNLSYAAIAPVRGCEMKVLESTPCLKILIDADNKMGRCSVFDFACLLLKDGSYKSEAKIYPYFIVPGGRNSKLCETIEAILKGKNLLYESQVMNAFKIAGEGFYQWRWDTYVHRKTEEKYFQNVPEECYIY